MSAMKIKLAQIEARLQSLIEGSAARLFPRGQVQTDLAARLVAAMQAGIQPRLEGPLAPNLYTLWVNPSQAGYFQANQGLIDALTHTLREMGAEAGLRFPSPPVIRVATDAEIQPGEVRVSARNSQAGLSQTSDLAVEPKGEEIAIPSNAFLIVDGMQILPLDQPVINIGRRPDNQLVIDDPRVSRVHAQLRAIRGRYVIFDLDSSGGTYVNGERIRQAVLYPGDVIWLTNLPLVYGQDDTGLGETQDYFPGQETGR